MKKMLVFILVAVLALPVSIVLAGAPMTFELEFRNQTGGMIGLDMVDANGNHVYTDVPTGVSTLDVLEGKYSYYATTACGVEVGQWNMNVKKVAIFKCEGKEYADLFVDLDRYCYFPGWYPVYFAGGAIHANPAPRRYPLPYPENFAHTNGCWQTNIFN